MHSPAFDGADVSACQSFAPTYLTASASAGVKIAGGSYSVRSTTDVDVRLSSVSSDTVSALATTQPAAANQTVRYFANVDGVLDVPLDDGRTYYWSAKGVSADGVIVLNGPMRRGTNR